MLRANSSLVRAAASAFAAMWLAYGCNTPSVTSANVAAAGGANPGTSGAAVPSSVKPQASDHEVFDSGRAMDILKKQCDFGVRPLGSDAHEKTKDYLVAQMKLYADETKLQEFKYRNMPVTNVIGVFYPEGSSKPAERPVVLMTHWDTRPIADGPNSSETARGVQFRYGATGWRPLAPIMGANDAASGVGVLLELARIFKKKRPPVGVIILLDDGEDYGDFRANNSIGDGVELGARYFAKNYHNDKAYGQPSYGILLDMVGSKNAIFVKEALSEASAPRVNEKVWNIARELGYSNIFSPVGSQDVGDDHVSMNAAGIPTIDIIHPLPGPDAADGGYRYWHTREDTADKCSAATLKAVGDTIAETIYREAPSK